MSRTLAEASAALTKAAERAYNRTVMERYSSTKEYDQAFFDACHSFAYEGDKMNMIDPISELYNKFTNEDQRVIWNTYVWHYYRAMNER